MVPIRPGVGTTVGPRLLGLKPINLLWSWLAYLAGGSDNIFACAERPIV